jgi:hypothetical protein
MGIWESNTNFEGDSGLLASTLTDVEAIESWSPVPFQVQDDVVSLRAGQKLAVEGALLGRGVCFTVDIAKADGAGLSLRASGPFEIDVEYCIESACRSVSARVQTRGRGPKAKLLASAANAMLAAGALDHALGRVVRHAGLEPVAAAA